MKTKIILSIATALTLLLTGCTDDQKAAAQAAMNQSDSIAGTMQKEYAKTSNDAVNTGDAETSNDGNADNGDGNSGDGFIPGPGYGSDVPTLSNKTGGWYGKTVVSATAADGTVYTHSTAGVFGELVDSSISIDQHDIPGFGTAILQIVFPQSDNNSNGDFFSNYQNFQGDTNTKRSWTFQIKNQQKPDLKDAAITITLPEIHKVTYKKVKGQIIYDKKELIDESKRAALTLKDVDNNTVYTVKELETANLTMQGLHTRTFAWEMGTEESADYVAPETVAKNANVTSDFASDKSTITSDDFDTASVKTANAGGKFGLPPM